MCFPMMVEPEGGRGRLPGQAGAVSPNPEPSRADGLPQTAGSRAPLGMIGRRDFRAPSRGDPVREIGTYFLSLSFAAEDSQALTPAARSALQVSSMPLSGVMATSIAESPRPWSMRMQSFRPNGVPPHPTRSLRIVVCSA